MKIKPTLHRLAAAGLASMLLAAMPASAAIVTDTYIGTWSTAANAPNPGMLARGGKYVIRATYDTADITTPTAGVLAAEGRSFVNGFSRVVLDNSGAAGTGNLELFVPMQGFGGIVSTQTGADHFPLGPGFAPTAEIQFFDGAGTQFRGFEFESDFLPGTTGLPGGGLIFEQFTSDVNFGGTTVTNSTGQIINGNNGFGVDIRSITVDTLSQDLGASGGQQNPGVFLSKAVPVVANAGAAMNFNAGQLTLTTDASTAIVTALPPGPPASGAVRTAPSFADNLTRQADNDLGAGRTDGEDFLSYAWTVNGAGLAGNQTGTRLDRTVADSANGPVFVNNAAPRVVNDVNVMVGIAASGLTKTTDTVQWTVQVTEDITGLTSTDTVTIGYDNAIPTIANATATASGVGNLDLDFALSGVDDVDLAVNALIAGFETLSTTILIDGVNQDAFFATLIGTGVQNVSNADLISQFGLGPHSFLARATDYAGAMAELGFDFDVLAGPIGNVPEPSSLALFGIAAAGLGLGLRRRRVRGKA